MMSNYECFTEPPGLPTRLRVWRDCTFKSKISSPITLKVCGRMHGNETDPRTDLNVHEQQYAYIYILQIRIITGKAHVSVKL